MTAPIAKGLPPAVVERLEEFLNLIAGASTKMGRTHAAIAVGWTPRQLRDLERNPEFQEVLAMANDLTLESLETKSYELAMAGNVPMLQMWLYCHGADRGWKPPAQRVAVQHQGHVTVERIQAVTSAARELLAEYGPEALALGGPLDAIDAEVIDDAVA